MKVAIMQPYFLPYIGYFQLIKHTDKFILFDPVQFIRHGWIERNRVLKPVADWQYISVPIVKQGRDALIADTKINNIEDWRSKMTRQLEHYKKRSPYYNQTMEVFSKAISSNAEDITHFNYDVLSCVCEYIGIDFNCAIFSDMNLVIEPAQAADEWALNICKAIGNVKEYWNPIGGLEFFDRTKYINCNVDIKFQKAVLEPYAQRRETFEPGLSILDVMMFNSPEEINKMLDKYELI